jgi:hypothetical protein
VLLGSVIRSKFGELQQIIFTHPASDHLPSRTISHCHEATEIAGDVVCDLRKLECNTVFSFVRHVPLSHKRNVAQGNGFL